MYDFIKPELDANAVIDASIEETLAIDPNASHAEISGKYTVSGNPELVTIEQVA